MSMPIDGTAVRFGDKLIMLPPGVKVLEESFVQLDSKVIVDLLILQTELLLFLIPGYVHGGHYRDRIDGIKERVAAEPKLILERPDAP